MKTVYIVPVTWLNTQNKRFYFFISRYFKRVKNDLSPSKEIFKKLIQVF